jgi:hypothetical protein
MGKDIVLKDSGLMLIRDQNLNQIGLLGCVGRTDRIKTMLPGQFIIFSPGTLADDNIYPGITQILGMGMPLAPIPDNGHGFIGQQM